MDSSTRPAERRNSRQHYAMWAIIGLSMIAGLHQLARRFNI